MLRRADSWARPADAVVHMMHNGWGNVQYAVGTIAPVNRTIAFARGGWQHGRGGGPSSWYIENQLELLDSPGEWYVDTAARKLYLWPNTSATHPVVAGAVLESVVVVNGTKAAPVLNVSFVGLGFSSTSPTFLKPYERPISGDWAIHRGGTVLVTGAASASFTNCNFTRTGGNALFFSRHVKQSAVTDSEFHSVGDSAVVAYVQCVIPFTAGRAFAYCTWGFHVKIIRE